MQGLFNCANDGIFSLKKPRYTHFALKTSEKQKKLITTRERSHSSNKLTLKNLSILSSQNNSESSYRHIEKLSIINNERHPTANIEKLSMANKEKLCISPERKQIFWKLAGESITPFDPVPNIKLPKIKKPKKKSPQNTSELLELKSFRKTDKSLNQNKMCNVGTNTSNESLNDTDDVNKKIYIGKGYRKRLIQILDVFPVNSTPRLENIHKNIKISRLKPRHN